VLQKLVCKFDNIHVIFVFYKHMKFRNQARWC